MANRQFDSGSIKHAFSGPASEEIVSLLAIGTLTVSRAFFLLEDKDGNRNTGIGNRNICHNSRLCLAA